jgi:hypothetical protein
MESPGPAHGHRGFLVQRNHESGGIVIVYSLPERRDSGNSAIPTFCHRDIFAIPATAIFKSSTHTLPLPENHTQAISSFLRPQASNQPISKSTLRESDGLRDGAR